MTQRDETALRTSYLSLFGNLLLALTKGIVGYLGNSYALIADAIESSTDVFSSITVVFGLRYARRPPDKDHPYGHGRIEPLITFLTVAFLLASASTIIYQSIGHIKTPHSAPELFTLPVLVGVIIIKEVFFRVIDRKGRKLKSTVLRADAWHHRSDSITSFIALIGILCALFLGEGYAAADDWAALFASAFIIYNAYRIFRPALAELMDEHRYDELVTRIRNEARKINGVLDTEKCFVRKSGIDHFVDLHLIVDGNISVREGHQLAHQTKEHLEKSIPEITQVLIHIEPGKLKDDDH